MIDFLKQRLNGTVSFPTIPQKTTREIIEQIHEDFYTEVDKLLAEANITVEVDVDRDIINKSNDLKGLGFHNTKEVKRGQQEYDTLNSAKVENEKKKELIEAITYFSQKYPHYKFITEDSVKKICNKYGLVYGEVSRYLGEVPDKNIKDMQRFKVDHEDKNYTCTNYMFREERVTNISYKSYKEHMEYLKRERESYSPGDSYRSIVHPFGYRKDSYDSSPLEIAAPKSDFNLEGMEIKDFKLTKKEIPDPVVLQPVHYKGKKHYLIVTAWGLEASDELVVNEKMN